MKSLKLFLRYLLESKFYLLGLVAPIASILLFEFWWNHEFIIFHICAIVLVIASIDLLLQALAYIGLCWIRTLRAMNVKVHSTRNLPIEVQVGNYHLFEVLGRYLVMNKEGELVAYISAQPIVSNFSTDKLETYIQLREKTSLLFSNY